VVRVDSDGDADRLAANVEAERAHARRM
jgi:hypothetical protein